MGPRGVAEGGVVCARLGLVSAATYLSSHHWCPAPHTSLPACVHLLRRTKMNYQQEGPGFHQSRAAPLACTPANASVTFPEPLRP